MISLLRGSIGMGEQEAARMPLALALLYCHAVALSNGVETRWLGGGVSTRRRSAEDLHTLLERMRAESGGGIPAAPGRTTPAGAGALD